MSLHPAVAAVRQCVRRPLADLPPGATVLVACSGGADSLALLSATVFEARRPGIRVVGATVDHAMQDDSAERAAAVVAQMTRIGADETVSARVEVAAEGMGPEAAARAARYAVLTEMAERFNAAAVLLGHTRDDQAETVLLGLARGSGGRSIAGMRRSFEVFRRPLLDVSRADTVTACRAEGIEFWADPHNEDDRFTRVRVRRAVMPVLENELGPGVAVALARTADLLRPDMEYLDELAGEALTRVAVEPAGSDLFAALDVAAVDGLPVPLRGRALRLAALAAGSSASELFAVHVSAMSGLVTGEVQGQVQLPGHVTAYRDGDHLRFRRTAAS